MRSLGIWNFDLRSRLPLRQSASTASYTNRKLQIGNSEKRSRARETNFRCRNSLIMIALRDSLGSDFDRRGPGSLFEELDRSRRRRTSSTGRSNRRWRWRWRGLWRKNGISWSRPGRASASRSPISRPPFFSRSAEKKKAVISTHTINLQEQLLYKDIPILQEDSSDRV